MRVGSQVRIVQDLTSDGSVYCPAGTVGRIVERVRDAYAEYTRPYGDRKPRWAFVIEYDRDGYGPERVRMGTTDSRIEAMR